MRLINVGTYDLEEFEDERQLPEYAILSHTWDPGHEVLFSDYEQVAQTLQRKHSGVSFDSKQRSVQKLKGACQLAEDDELQYIWIDSICIDKRSSSELSEAINSMFRWYQNAVVCYVYMADVRFCHSTHVNQDAENEMQFVDSRWFRRGWTLQELLAPRKIMFHDSEWDFPGGYEEYVLDEDPLSGDDTGMQNRKRLDLAMERDAEEPASLGFAGELTDIVLLVEKATSIDSDVLHHIVPLGEESIATRMSWASDRKTTGIEDETYCLLGIFEVNMPMLYGEGNKAFRRLQEEIIRRSNDQSIFAWHIGNEQLTHRDMFAPSPR